MAISEIVIFRLRNQRIATYANSGSLETPGELVTRMGAIQAQDYAGAKWSLGLRLPGTTVADIDRAIEERSIVRTWPMRGTLHLVSAADISWMLSLLTPRIIAASATRHQQLGLDESTFATTHTIFREALQGGITLTRDALLERLEEAGISVGSQRGYHLLWRCAQEGLICFSSHQGKQPAFALLDDWIPPLRRVAYEDRTEALGELARRYFTSHGPATVRDFAWWAGLTMGDARKGLEEAKTHLESVAVDGNPYWMPPGEGETTGNRGEEREGLYLLPGFDEYMLGYKDRSAALDPEDARKIVPGSNGVFLPTIVSRGRVIGIWRKTITKRQVNILPEPFRPLSDSEGEAFVVAAEKYKEFLMGE